MNSGHVLNIVGTVCNPDGEAAFNEWYDGEHVPINMSCKQVLGVTRYRLVRSYDWARAKEYPKFLAAYRFADVAAFQTWNAGPERTEAHKSWTEVVAKTGARLVWRAQFHCLQTWGKTLPHSVITVVGTQCPAEKEARFDTWYNQKHIPDILKSPKLLGVTRYKLSPAPPRAGAVETEYPRNLTFCHFDNAVSFDNVRSADAYDNGPERAAAHGDYAKVAAETGAYTLWRAQFEPLKTWLR